MENKVIIELSRYEELMKQSFESDNLKKEVNDLKSEVLKLKRIILTEHEDNYNLARHKLDECVDFKSCFCAINNVDGLLSSGLFTKQEIDEYIVERWCEYNEEEE